MESGANVHAQTQTGDTALTYACENGHTDVAEVLLYYNAELEHESEGGRTPLMKACRAGHICTVKFLIGKGADVNRQTTNNDHTPLSLACAGGHQAVVEFLLKSGADPFHKLKDNSTMLIEAAKGGHIGVVQLLLDYPQSMVNNVANRVPSNNSHIQATQQQLQQQPFMITQPQQPPTKQHLVTQAQLMHAPPGLHEVPEAVRVSNQQIFHQQSLPIKDNNLDQQQIISNSQIVATSTCNIPGNQPESILTQMRLLQMHAFNDGLVDGLTYGQTVTQQAIVNNNSAIIVPQNNITNQSVSSPGQQIVKPQKSLLRHKNRQIPSSFESNLTTSEAQQVRSQPVGEDENPIQLTSNSGLLDDQHKKLFQEYQHGVNLLL